MHAKQKRHEEILMPFRYPSDSYRVVIPRYWGTLSKTSPLLTYSGESAPNPSGSVSIDNGDTSGSGSCSFRSELKTW